MATKTQKRKSTSAMKRSTRRTTRVPGLAGVCIVKVGAMRILELRDRLDMPREIFSRLVNVSVRAIADVESRGKKVAKLQRPYNEVGRLCAALGEVVDSKSIGAWIREPNDALSGFKPIEIIERGEIDRLWQMVYLLRSGQPG